MLTLITAQTPGCGDNRGRPAGGTCLAAASALHDMAAVLCNTCNSVIDIIVTMLLFFCLQAFDSDIRINEQHLSVLNFLSHDLITQFHGRDDSEDLKNTMADLNMRWKKLEEK